MFQNDLIDPSQLAFASCKFCFTQHFNCHGTLDPFTGLWYMYGCYNIYLDITKALPPSHMPDYYLNLNNIASIGGDLLQWITQYLIGRKHYVVLNGCKSNWEPDVRSSVPQGTILGLILFIVYPNNLPSFVNSQCLMFTDDTKFY